MPLPTPLTLHSPVCQPSPGRAAAFALTAAALAFGSGGALAQVAANVADQAKASTATRPAPAARAAAAPRPQAAAAAAAASSLCARVAIAPMVQIPVGKSTVLRPSSPVTRILLGNPDNAQAARPAEADGKKEGGGGAAASGGNRPGVADVDVLLLAPTEVYLLGKTLGSTNVVMLDRTGTCTAFDVVVGMDTTALQAVLGTLLPNEKGIKVSSAFDSIVLSGIISDSEALARATELAGAYVGGGVGGKTNPRIVNMLEVAAPQQVMLEVKVAEISKALIDKLGVQIAGSRTNGSWTYNVISDFLAGGNALTSAVKNAANTLGVTIDAQKDDGLIKILAEPTIMAISGQTGSFLAGGKIFIPVASDAGNGGGRTITLEEKEFGVSVKFTPTVLGNGNINLRVRPEVSELNKDGIGIVASGVAGTAILPSFTSRKAETTVQLQDGQSFAIGGLIKNNVTTNIKAVPLLGELPILGALFRSTSFQADRSELVFVITPRLVKPLPPNYRMPTDDYVEPTRGELMMRGKLEGAGPATPAMAPQGGFEKEKK